MQIEQPHALGARWIHPMLGAPLENHWINITDCNVDSITREPAYAPARYLGNSSVILPAAINAHAHLELSQLEAPLDVPSRTMSDWIAALVAFRRSAVYDAEKAIQQALCRPDFLESTAVVADIAPDFAVDRRQTTDDRRFPLTTHNVKWLPFTELIAWRHEAAKNLHFPTSIFGLSPHAPHTICPALLEKAITQNVPLAMHLAETTEELQLLRHHHGPLLDMMRRVDPDYNPKSVLLGKRPMDYLQLLSAAPSAFVIHGNYLDDEELRFLAAHRETMSVVYCPRSHAYFRHVPYPLKKMLDYGVRVLLGTDSLASVPNLCFAEEMQFAITQHPTISPEIIYRLGTLEGSKAFDLLSEGFGTIQPGSPARFVMFVTTRQ